METQEIIKKYEEIMRETNKASIECNLEVKQSVEKMGNIKKKAEKDMAELSYLLKSGNQDGGN